MCVAPTATEPSQQMSKFPKRFTPLAASFNP
jgi:hypothetical protein